MQNWSNFSKLLFSFFAINVLFLSYTSALKAQDHIPQSVPALIDSIEHIMERKKIAGLMLTLVENDSIIFCGGLGYSNLSTEQKVDKNTLFRVGSITKSLVSLAVIKLIREDKFTLNSNLKEVAPEVPFTNEWEETDPIKIVHLLEHTTGFDDMHFSKMYNLTGEDISIEERLKNDETSLISRWRPGTRHSYSNPGYTILGYLVEKYAGKSFEAYVTDEILKPIGMEHANLLSFPKDKASYAQGYDYDKGDFKEVPFYAINSVPAGALNASATDMAEFLKFFLNNGLVDSTQFFSAEEINEMEKVHSTLAAKNGLENGYGLGNYTSGYGQKQLFQGHNGGIDGFISSYAYNRELGIGYAVSNNTSNGMGDVIKLVKSFLLRNSANNSISSTNIDASSLKEFEGYYQFKNPRNHILDLVTEMFNGVDVSIEDGKVFYKSFMQDKKLLAPVGNYLFKTEESNFANTVFMLTPSGKQAIELNGLYFEKGSFAYILWLRVIIFGNLLIALVSAITFLSWLILFSKKELGFKNFMVRTMPFLALLCFVIMLYCLQSMLTGNIVELATMNGAGLSFLISSVLLPILSVVALISIFLHKEKMSRFLQVWLIVSSVFVCCLSYILYDYGFIGLKIWEY
ncbi:serine hydrolase domain-containing protein [Chondrinema litorale]|uniref:serine hydrolase domain-containing protein n=1 Tax=Chondrinema litorale TaxID=2994555 RepID=UPI0025433D0B|nr:serine hydrolase [Chondrinema litorale]UZR92662.1 serine hydrolase [Chondrinema litorale]